MASEFPEVSIPLSHPALKRHWLLSEYGLTDRDLEGLSAKSLNYELVINNALQRALKIRQSLREKEAEKGIGRGI